MKLQRRQPYFDRLMEVTKTMNDIHFDQHNRIVFDTEFIYYIVKCTGLKSKKRRKILKRGRIIVLKLLREAVGLNV